MSGATSKGIVYPTNTDNIDFTADMQALAESVNDNFLRLSGEALTGAITANSGINKGYRLNNEGGFANARLWSNYVSGNTWRVAAVNDAASVGTDFLTLDRVASKITLEKPAKMVTNYFRAIASGSLAANQSAWAAFNFFTTLEADEGGGFSLANDQYVVPTSGLWYFQTWVSFSDSAKLSVALKTALYVNGSPVYEDISPGNTDASTAASRKSSEIRQIVQLDAGDVVKLWYTCNATTATPLEDNTSSRRPLMMGYMISAT